MWPQTCVFDKLLSLGAGAANGIRFIANEGKDKRAKQIHKDAQRLCMLKHKYFASRDNTLNSYAPYINDLFDNAQKKPCSRERKEATREVLENLFKKHDGSGHLELNLSNPFFNEARTRYYICLHIWQPIGDYL